MMAFASKPLSNLAIRFALSLGCFASGNIFAFTGTASAGEGLSLADSMSFIEKPLALKLGDATFTLRGSIEQAAQVRLDKSGFQGKTTGQFRFSAETKLRNRLRVGASYGGQLTNRPNAFTDVGGYKNDKYTDSAEVFVQGVWGRLTAGSVRGQIDKSLIRSAPAGNAALAFRGSIGRLEEWGGVYSGRYGPAVIALAVDQEGHIDGGLRWSRPIGNKDIGFAVRGTLGTFLPHDGSAKLDTTGVNVMADVIYGSSLLELALGYETLQNNTVDTDRVYASLGLHHKIDAVTLSLMGHYGQIAGSDEISVALGARYDISRGLSANAGINYAKASAKANGGTVTLVEKDAVEGSLSLRYEF